MVGPTWQTRSFRLFYVSPRSQGSLLCYVCTAGSLLYYIVTAGSLLCYAYCRTFIVLYLYCRKFTVLCLYCRKFTVLYLYCWKFTMLCLYCRKFTVLCLYCWFSYFVSGHPQLSYVIGFLNQGWATARIQRNTTVCIHDIKSREISNKTSYHS